MQPKDSAISPMPSPEDAGTDADHMIAGFQAAFQRAPEGEHTFAGHQDDIVLCAHKLADAAAGGVVKAQEVGFDLPRAVIPAEDGNDVFVQGRPDRGPWEWGRNS